MTKEKFIDKYGWIIISIIFTTLFSLVFILPIYYDVKEKGEFIDKYGATKDELKCKDFCYPYLYYFDEGGLFSSDNCVCRSEG